MDDTGYWYILQNGRLHHDLGAVRIWRDLIPADAAFDPSQWNLAALNPYVQRFDQNFNQSATGRSTCRGRPTRSGSATTGAPAIGLTINYGVRWDDDSACRRRRTCRVNVDSDRQRRPEPDDFGYKTDIRDHRQHRAARRLHLQRRRQQRPRHPRRQRALLTPAGLERHLQPAGLQPTGHRFVHAGGERVVWRRFVFITNPTSGVTAAQLLPGRPRAGAVAAHHRRPTSKPLHLAEQHRLPEAD